MTAYFVLAHPTARKRAMQALAECPDGYVVKIEEPKRDSAHNAALHALLQQISERRTWCGQRQDVDTWRRLFMAAFMRTQNEQPVLLPAIDGHGLDIVFHSSRKLTNRKMQELISFIEAWDATTETPAAASA